MSRNIIDFYNLKLNINDRPLLDIPELSLYQGSCTVLSGINGSGKTTLMKIISGLQKPDACQVKWQQQAMMNWKHSCNLLHRHIVYLHQQPFLFDTSVHNNIAYGLKHKKLSRSQAKALIHEALEWVGLSDLAGRHARRLSGGEKQRVALARAFVLQPQVMLMDEPTANMDQSSRAQTFKLIRQLKERGISVMISSHELEQLDAIGDRQLRLRDSRLETKQRELPIPPQTQALRLII